MRPVGCINSFSRNIGPRESGDISICTTGDDIRKTYDSFSHWARFFHLSGNCHAVAFDKHDTYWQCRLSMPPMSLVSATAAKMGPREKTYIYFLQLYATIEYIYHFLSALLPFPQDSLFRQKAWPELGHFRGDVGDVSSSWIFPSPPLFPLDRNSKLPIY